MEDVHTLARALAKEELACVPDLFAPHAELLHGHDGGLYEDQFDDTNTTDHRRRFADEAVTIGGRTRYNLRCPKCDRRRKRRPVTVPVKQDRLQSVCDLLAGAGHFAPTLSAFAAIVRRSGGREH